MAQEKSCREDTGVARFFQVLYLLMYMLAFAYFSWKLRGSYDNFGIKRELKYTAYFSSVTLIIWVPWIFVPALEDFNNDVGPYQQ